MALSQDELRRIVGRTDPDQAWASSELHAPGDRVDIVEQPGIGFPSNPWGYGLETAERSPLAVSDYLAAGLKNPRLVQGLNRLETALTEAMTGREQHFGVPALPTGPSWTYDEIYAALAPVGAKNDTRRNLINHLLRETLLGALEEHGFEPLLDDKPLVRPLGILGNRDFYTPMQLRQHMKDVLVGLDHGEWTHLLQWYLLTVSPPDTEFKFEPAAVFEYLGHQGEHQYDLNWADPQQQDMIGPRLWQACCDRVAPYNPNKNYLAEDMDDFRCPDMLHVSLAGYADIRLTIQNWFPTGAPSNQVFDQLQTRWEETRKRWPLLCAILRRRLVKRNFIYERAGDMRETIIARIAQAVRTGLSDDNLPYSQWVDLSSPQTDLKKFVRGRTYYESSAPEFRPNWDMLRMVAADKKEVDVRRHRIWKEIVGPMWFEYKGFIERKSNLSERVLYLASKRDEYRYIVLSPDPAKAWVDSKQAVRDDLLKAAAANMMP